ncbi:MAG: riboflavin biosynthesis protein RibF [Bacilli bacterium]|nr:riboflavin biosynthesis protein RibF [Bacilli bacterium]
MELIEFHQNEKFNIGKIVLALGIFDGLHLAHQLIIQKAVAEAQRLKIKSAVMTFDPHPDYVLKKRENRGYLTPLSEKKNFMEKMGVDYLIIVPFTTKISETTADDFENDILNRFDIVSIVIGYDYTYGYKGQGTALKLAHKFNTIIVDEQLLGDERYASDIIRKNLLEGNLQKVTEMLGRYYNISGKVARGNQIGRKIGFRTANIILGEEYQTLKIGVYGVIVTIDDKKYLGVCNIGHNPSVKYLDEPRLEVHVLDFVGDLYSKYISVDFVMFIRDEKKFATIDELVARIKVDVDLVNQKMRSLI